MSYGNNDGGIYKNCLTDVCNCFMDSVTVMNMAQWSIRAAHFKPRQVPKGVYIWATLDRQQDIHQRFSVWRVRPEVLEIRIARFLPDDRAARFRPTLPDLRF